MIKSISNLKKIILFIVIIYNLEISAQENPSSEAFNLVSADYLGTGSTPKVNLKTYKFTALVGKSELDFYLYNSVPTMAPKFNTEIRSSEEATATQKYLANDILHSVGGLLNVSLGKVIYFTKDKTDPEIKYIKGLQMDIHTGGKLVECPLETGSKYFSSAQSFIDIRYLIPLQDKSLLKEGVNKRESFVGNLSLRVQGAFQQFFTARDRSDLYSSFFTSFENQGTRTLQIIPQSRLFTGHFETYFYLTNKIYISAGYLLSSDKLIGNYPFFSISYGTR